VALLLTDLVGLVDHKDMLLELAAEQAALLVRLVLME
jgi:hypothetical protein